MVGPLRFYFKYRSPWGITESPSVTTTLFSLLLNLRAGRILGSISLSLRLAGEADSASCFTNSLCTLVAGRSWQEGQPVHPTAADRDTKPPLCEVISLHRSSNVHRRCTDSFCRICWPKAMRYCGRSWG